MPLQPFLLGIRERLDEGTRRRLGPGHAAPERVADTYAAAVSSQLFRIASPLLLSELRRFAGGDCQRQRLTGFTERLCTRAGLAAFLSEYPVLARLLGMASQRATEAGLELVDRFAADRAAVVAELLGGHDPGPVVEIEPGLGDRHRGGRTVTAVSFADGRAVIYRPRDVAVYAAFGQVIDWLNQRLPAAGLRAPVAIRRNGYGWVEFIESKSLSGVGAAAEFYWREGALLAALYATHACDIRGENLVACGAVPVVVDVETLFQPSLPAPLPLDPAAEELDLSVWRTALLPRAIADADTVRAVGNRPLLDGEPVEPAGYEPQILQGFRAAYNAIVADRHAFGALIEGSGVAVRVAFRPAPGYAHLIDESVRPHLLRCADIREEALRSLRQVSAHHPLWSRTVRHELTDLLDGDMPLMTADVSARDLWVSAGHRLPGVLDRTGLSRVMDKIAAMGEADRGDQEWFISACLATRRPHQGHRSTDLVPGPVAVIAAEPIRLLAAACGVADQIVARAATGREDAGRGRVNWVGLRLADSAQWTVAAMGAGLGDGYLGVALFLAQLAELTGIGRYADLARRAVIAVPELLDRLAGSRELIAAVGAGAADGLGGISYALARISGLLNDRELGEWSIRAAELGAIADELPGTPWWAAGSAGYLAAMASVQAETGSMAVGRLATACAERLGALVERTEGRCVPFDAPAPSGFTTGSVGVGWALHRFAGLMTEPHYRVAGRRAVSHAIARAGLPGTEVSPGWCSGSAGLLLGRLCLPAVADDLQAAISDLARRPVLADLSLCHGEFGISEVLTTLAAASQTEAAERALRLRSGILLDAVRRHAPSCGTPAGLATPGLLNGLAGIGYGLLRLGFADRVPSALLLEPKSAQ